MSTPSNVIDTGVQAGRLIDQRFPGLRERDHHAWMAKVVTLANQGAPADWTYGKKSAHGPQQAVSGDTFGVLGPDQGPPSTGRRPFYAVSIIRDNPPVNEWRTHPHDYGLIEGQYWIEQEPVEVAPGGGTEEPGEDPDEADDAIDDVLKSLESIVRQQALLLDQGETQLGYAKLSAEQLTAIRGDIRNFTQDVQRWLPAILTALAGRGGTGDLGGLIGTVLNRKPSTEEK